MWFTKYAPNVSKKKFVLLGSLVLSLILSSCVIPTSDDLTPIPVNQIRTFPTIGVKSIASNKAWTPYIEIMSGVQMALVPPGCFIMGAAEDQIDYLIGIPGIKYGVRGLRRPITDP